MNCLGIKTVRFWLKVEKSPHNFKKEDYVIQYMIIVDS